MNLELNFLSTCILEISNLSIILLGIRKASLRNIAWETSPQKTKQFLHYGLIKHSGILPHMATYGHTESIFPQNLQKWSHIIWNILKTCTFMKIQVVFRSFIASHTRIPATSPPLPFSFGPKTGFPTAPHG